MPHIFTNVKYADMLLFDSFCDNCGTVAVEYQRRFPMCRIPDHRVFSKVFNTLRECSMLPSAHVSPERACQQLVKEQKNILEMV
jgi:tRNA A37 threonylcarbamoyladenosine synthetase subunit TsaC/SUA5/YrdC